MSKIVFAGFYNSGTDFQRGIIWEADVSQLYPLIESIKPGWHLVLFHDCLDGVENTDKVTFVKSSSDGHDVYRKKWFDTMAYLDNHPEVEAFFMVDSTDVVMCNDPIMGMAPDKVYVGSVTDKLGCGWMRWYHSEPYLLPLIELNKDYPLLNCGTWGAYRDIGIRFLRLYVMYAEHHSRLGSYGYPVCLHSDIGIFNYISYTYFKDSILYGDFMNTEFRGYVDPLTTTSWWKHK